MHCLIGRNFNAFKDKYEGKDFIHDVRKELPKEYSRCQIYFVIALHKLESEYNNIMFVSIPTGTLKSKFSLIKQLVRQDEDFWKYTHVVWQPTDWFLQWYNNWQAKKMSMRDFMQMICHLAIGGRKGNVLFCQMSNCGYVLLCICVSQKDTHTVQLKHLSW